MKMWAQIPCTALSYLATEIKIGYDVSRAASEHTECVHYKTEQFVLQ
jgi:hypothetical protein